MSESQTFTQFSYCSLCRTSYKKSRKHVYSKRHQEIVTNILKKFNTKIQNAKLSSAKPTIRTLKGEDREVFFWCYFCQKDVHLHSFKETHRGDCVIVNAGILEHISGTDHGLNAEKFLKENRVSAERKQEFVMTSQGFMKFMESANAACETFFKEKAEELQRIKSTITEQRFHRHHVMLSAVMDKNVEQSRRKPPEDLSRLMEIRKDASPFEVLERKRTVKAFGDGLTPLDRSKEDDSLGNIYTNALPPWLRADPNDVSEPAKIGPDISDLEKYKKLVKKSLLSADRTGAKFDRNADQSDNWLPAFGGVWTHNARTHSVKQFSKKQNSKGSNSMSSVPHTILTNVPTMASDGKPYRTTEISKNTPETSTNHHFSYTSSYHNQYEGAPSHHPAFFTDNKPCTTFHQNYGGEDRDLSYNTQSTLHSHKDQTLSHNTLSVQDDSFVSLVGIKPYVRKRKCQNSAVSVNEISHPYTNHNLQHKWSRTENLTGGGSQEQGCSTMSHDQESYSLISTPVLYNKK